MGQQKQKYAATSAESKSTGKRKITVGSVWESKSFGKFEVIHYQSFREITVRFIKTGYEVKVQGGRIRLGQVKDKLAKSYFGVGFIGVGKYDSYSDQYKAWNSMMVRCYSESYQSKRPTYKDCTVCDEWHNFQNFAKWYDKNHPSDGRKYHLDKDLKIIGNKIYSPETCLFVDPNVNLFTINSVESRGNCVIGVSFINRRSRFVSACSNPFSGKQEQLGYFYREIDAHMAWRRKKSELAYALAMIQDRDEVKQALLNWRGALDRFEIHKVSELLS